MGLRIVKKTTKKRTTQRLTQDELIAAYNDGKLIYNTKSKISVCKYRGKHYVPYNVKRTGTYKFDSSFWDMDADQSSKHRKEVISTSKIVRLFPTAAQAGIKGTVSNPSDSPKLLIRLQHRIKRFFKNIFKN